MANLGGRPDRKSVEIPVSQLGKGKEASFFVKEGEDSELVISFEFSREPGTTQAFFEHLSGEQVEALAKILESRKK